MRADHEPVGGANVGGIILLGLATMPAAASTIATWPWSMIGVLVTLITWPITLGFVIYYNRRPERRKYRLREPVDAFFIVPAAQYHDCAYSPQNEHEHHLKTLVLSSHSEITVDLVIEAKMDFNTSQVYIGCVDEKMEKPYAFAINNRFVEIGSRRNARPGENGCEDYIDKYHYYHVVENTAWSIGAFRAFGFDFRTGAPGKHQVRIWFTGDAAIGKIDDLYILVEDEPRTKMFCVAEKHQHMDCAAGPPKPREHRVASVPKISDLCRVP